MNTQEKIKQLQKHKLLATTLFVFMAIVFVTCTIILKKQNIEWLGFVKAFAEAAMIGALADWFAVTALFHHPLGLKIPHTNLIENSKEKIGNNLGQFVVENFLSPKNIRPYIEKLKISELVSNWLSKENNRKIIISESLKIAQDIITQLDDNEITQYLSEKAKSTIDLLDINKYISKGIRYFVDKNEHQPVITQLSEEITKYISNHKNIIREKVQNNSYSFIPKFIDDKIADKITDGLIDFFNEVAMDKQHELRNEITSKIVDFSNRIEKEKYWVDKIDSMKDTLLSSNKINTISQEIWISVKTNFTNEIQNENGFLIKTIDHQLLSISKKLKDDIAFQEKTDNIVKKTAYLYFLRNRDKFGKLISDTVGNWQGKDLSQKLELEVGKDLQFIRINGTLVGGLVGLIIYTIVHFVI
ncbi:MAG: DUF445 domain-containing protein [Bacteroidetes bacterium]|nr:DUF445 domain-containing protein [Bacteroidota bacterium]